MITPTVEEVRLAVAACGGNFTEAGKRLGVSRDTVRRRLHSSVGADVSNRLGSSSLSHNISPPKSHSRVDKIAFLSDIHFPFEDRIALQAVVGFLKDWKPTEIVLGGDIFDCYSVSDYDKEPGRHHTLQDEFDSASDFLRAVDELAKGKVRFFIGNHENRINRHISAYPGLYKLRSLDFGVAAGLPRHWTVHPSQYHHRVGGLLLLHGDLRGRVTSGGINPAATMLRKLRTSCMFGHWHRHGQYFETNYDGTVRGGFANGHLSDVKEAKYITSPDWQSGFTTIASVGDKFAVQQRLIIDGRLITDEKIYG